MVSYIFALGTMLILPVVGIMAFGGKMTDPNHPNTIIYFNEDFKDDLPFIYYFVSFYIFLNVVAFPVLTITIRNNSMKLINPDKVPEKSYSITKYTLIYTGIILGFIFACAIVL